MPSLLRKLLGLALLLTTIGLSTCESMLHAAFPGMAQSAAAAASDTHSMAGR